MNYGRSGAIDATVFAGNILERATIFLGDLLLPLEQAFGGRINFSNSQSLDAHHFLASEGKLHKGQRASSCFS